MNAFKWRALLVVWLVSTLILQETYGSDQEHVDNIENSETHDDPLNDYCSDEGVSGESTCGAESMDEESENIDENYYDHDFAEEYYSEEDNHHEESDRRELSPWEIVHNEFECDYHLDPLLMSEQSWQLVRDRFQIFQDQTNRKHRKNGTMKDGFYVPYEIRVNYDDDSNAPPHGIYATKFIPKGTLVYRASIQRAIFESFDQFIEFLNRMDFTQALKCNLLFWSYGGEPHDPSFVLMDSGSLMNTKWYFFHPEEVENNIGLICPHEKCINNDSYYALRDIEEDEEIISDFDIYITGSNHMGNHFDHNLSLDNMIESRNDLNPILRLHWWIYNPYFRLGDVRQMFNCDHVIYSTHRPIHTPEVWETIRQHYYQQRQQIEGKSNDKIATTSSSLSTSTMHSSGFKVPYEVRYIEGRGRCVFATEHIPKGTFVFDDKPFMAKFTTRLDFLRYLATIPLGNDMVCDIIEWSYASNFNDYYGAPNDDDDRSNVAIVFVMDEGSLINDAGDEAWEENLQYEPNIGCPHKMEGQRTKDCLTQLYSLQDIQPGEEITCNYHDFCRQHYWKVFDL